MKISGVNRVDLILTVILAICAVVTVGVLVRREFASPASTARIEQKPIFVKKWRTHLGKGVRIGPADAPVQLLEFADFECPFCATFHQHLKTLRERYPGQIALTYVHYPLPMHRFAEPAARVSECAGEQGRFEGMHERLFAQQNSFGLKPWSEFAAEAGVPDMTAFEACIKSTEPLPRIEQGKQLAQELEVRGTPTLLINGWKLGRPPGLEELDSMVKTILAGKSPIATDGKPVRSAR